MDFIIYDEWAEIPEDMWRKWVEHITDGRPCWCQPVHEEGVVTHSEDAKQ